MTDTTCERIEGIVAHPVGRGAEAFLSVAAGHLRRAAESLLAGPVDAVIVTGFFIPRAGAAETDGPVGAAQLAAALTALGGTVRVVTDEPCATVVAAAGIEPDVAPLAGFDGWLDGALARYAGVTHLIAIERPGPDAGGTPRSMRGADLSAHTAPLDRLYVAGPWVRVAIGDGGNELGMGVLPEGVFVPPVALPAPARCVVGCDALVVGGTSNWGAAGLVAALVALGGRPDLAALLAPAWSRAVLDAIVAAGAVDGVTGRRESTVDGLVWEDYAAPLAQLCGLLGAPGAPGA